VGAGLLDAQAPEAPPRERLTLGDTGFRLDLEDQHGETVTYPLPAKLLDADGSPPVVLVIWADRRGADGRQGWKEALRNRYPEALDRARQPGLVVLPVAHLPDVPGPVRALIRNRFFDDRPPTALDWKKTVARQLGHEPHVPNLAVLAPDGALAARLSGEATEDNRRALFRVLDALLTADREGSDRESQGEESVQADVFPDSKPSTTTLCSIRSVALTRTASPADP